MHDRPRDDAALPRVVAGRLPRSRRAAPRGRRSTSPAPAGPSGWLARHQPARAVRRRRRTGRHRRPGRSTSIVAGAGRRPSSSRPARAATARTWAAVHDELAATTRTCAYDRAGRGRSDPRRAHTLADAAADLRRAAGGRRASQARSSWSATRSAAPTAASSRRRTGGEVAGLVLVDAFNPDLEETWIHPLLGPLRGEYEARLDGLRAHVAGVDSLDWPASEAQLRGVVAARACPIEVLVAPRGEPRLDEATNTAIAEAWRAAFESLSPGHVAHTVAWGAGHDIQIDRPDLVIESVRRLLALGR